VAKVIYVASNNDHKISEIRQILTDFDVRPASCLVEHFEVDETGKSFCENARIKAQALAKYTDEIVLADDSGLEVFALGMEPGIYSARYAQHGNDKANVKKLLDKMHMLKDRRARFVCCMVAVKGDRMVERTGYVYGTIAPSPQGKGGFGYDPVFVPDGYDVTFAEMKPEEKNAISHRRRALEAIKEALKELL